MTERLIAEFRPDRNAYFREQAVLALLALVAGVALVQLLRLAAVWTALVPLALALAVILRAVMGQAVAMAGVWRLTDRRLAGPGGVAMVLADVTDITTSLGSVVVLTAMGDRQKIRHLADAPGAALLIQQARDEAKKRPRGLTQPPPGGLA